MKTVSSHCLEKIKEASTKNESKCVKWLSESEISVMYYYLKFYFKNTG